ncbi:hypothetical protein [Salinivibrio socompensis]|nr:hypothetical protein [Salinivibrio socompensis]
MAADNFKDFDEALDSKIKAAEFLTMRSMGTKLRSEIFKEACKLIVLED